MRDATDLLDEALQAPPDVAAETGEVDAELREVEERARPSANDELRAKLRRREDEQPPAEPMMVEKPGADVSPEMSEEEKRAAVDAEWQEAKK